MVLRVIFAQIKQGAPYDIFFSADSSYPMHLEEEGLAVKELKGFMPLAELYSGFPRRQH